MLGLRETLHDLNVEVISTVCAGHLLSHFYILTFPPLFPTLQAELGLSSFQLGLLASVAVVGQVVLQIPIGGLVDRTGAKRVFVAGTLTAGLGIFLSGLAGDFRVLVVTIGLAGIGQAAFHPADYPLLAEASTEDTVGKVFSFHTFAGFVGYAVAPVVVGGLNQLYGWNVALFILGLVGVGFGSVAWIGMSPIYRESMGGESPAETDGAETGPEAKAEPGPGTKREGETETGTEDQADRQDGRDGFLDGFGRFFRVEILLLFAFFVLTAMASSGLRAFTTVFLVNAFEFLESTSNLALTIYVATMTGGVLVGGFVADRYSPYQIIPVAFVIAALGVVRLTGGAFVSAPPSTFGWFAVVGLFSGIVLPARDQLINTFSTAKSAGRSFGFAFTGVSIGGLVAPLGLGALFDVAGPRAGFISIAVMFLAGAGIVVLTLLYATREGTDATTAEGTSGD